MQTEIRDWGDAVWTSLPEVLGMFVAAIPKIIGFLIIFIIGWLIAGLVEKGFAALLRTVKSENLAARSSFSRFVPKISVKADSAGIIALIVLVAAVNSLGLPAVLDVVSQRLPELPNLIVVIVVLGIGGLVAGALSSLVRGVASNAELGNPDLLATTTSVTVWAFAIIIAINQVGIAVTLVGVFIVSVGSVALTFGLVFGLSGRETAVEIVRGWYEKGKQAIPKIKEVTYTLNHKRDSKIVSRIE